MSDEDGPVRLHVKGFIPTHITHMLPTVGTVSETGRVVLDDEDDELTLVVPSEADLSSGTSGTVMLRRRNVYFKPDRQRKREKYEQQAQKFLRAREQRKERERRKREAEEFWSQYNIPFKYDIAIKGRRSGLLRESDGTGRASNTKEHLYVCESFDEGRLSRIVSDGRRDRSEGVYLCDDQAEFRVSGIRRSGPDGDSYRPPVTCSACLTLMERWKTVATPDEREPGGVADGE